MLYVKDNEHTKRVKIVMVVNDKVKMPKDLPHEIDFIDRVYPEIKMDFEVIDGDFGPKLVKELSEKWGIPINFMFIGSPSDKFPFRVEQLGGVRVIM